MAAEHNFERASANWHSPSSSETQGMIYVPPELPKPPVVPPPPNKPPPVVVGAAPKPVPVEPKPVGRREHLGKRLIALGGPDADVPMPRGAGPYDSRGERERDFYIPVVGVEVEPKPPKPPVDCCCCCCCCWPKPPKPPKPDIVAEVSCSELFRSSQE